MARALLGATLYPAFLLVVSLGVLAVMAFAVAPSLADVFSSMDKPTPGLLGVLTTSSSWLATHWTESILGALVLAASTIIAARQPWVRRRTQYLLYRLPLVGQMLLWTNAERIAAALHLCLSTHVPADTALEVAFAVSARTQRATALDAALKSLRRGDGMAAALSAEGLLPAEARELVVLGERSGRLLDALAAIVAEANNRVEGRLTLMSSLLAPLLILVVGALAGSVIYSVFSALMDLNTLAQR